MNNPEVSVIIPVYNCKEYLSDCLNSLQKQTFKNIEIIIVNDGSTDGSKDIILDYAAGDNRIKYFEQVNSGVSASRNKGFEISSGEYIIFVDSDDWVSPDYIEKLYNALIKEGCDISVCSVLNCSCRIWQALPPPRHRSGLLPRYRELSPPLRKTSRAKAFVVALP